MAEVGPLAELDNSTLSKRIKIQLKNRTVLQEKKHMVAQTLPNTSHDS